MKFIVLALFCAVAFAAAQEATMEEAMRYRREANPQGSVRAEVKKPLGGPDRRPSVDVDFQRRVYDRNGMTADAYGGFNASPGMKTQPHAGIRFEKEYKNGQLGGFGAVQRGRGGRPDPVFGISGSWRFRRDAQELMEEEEQQ
ncbi:hymenoptaecin [Xylocopa sonorina]|uniref:hymenoptaecin n=1 Tax=Xylocopa sonorina TaxID=1818115 RepID=UPI00403ACF7D